MPITVVENVGTSFSAWVDCLPGTKFVDVKLIDPTTLLPVAGVIEWGDPDDTGAYVTSPDKVSAGAGASAYKERPGGCETVRGSGLTLRVRAKADAGSGYEMHVDEG